MNLQVDDATLSRSARKTLASTTGWGHLGFLGKLAELYGFDLVKDVVTDLMHLSMVLIKDLAHATCDVFNGWPKKPMENPCHINNWENGFFIDHLLYGFRRNMSSGFSRGRRFARDLSHASVSSWSAEEALIFLRLQWRWLLQQFLNMWQDAGNAVPEVFVVLTQAWELLEAFLLPQLDRRGCQETPENVRTAALHYMLHLATAQASTPCIHLQLSA